MSTQPSFNPTVPPAAHPGAAGIDLEAALAGLVAWFWPHQLQEPQEQPQEAA